MVSLYDFLLWYLIVTEILPLVFGHQPHVWTSTPCLDMGLWFRLALIFYLFIFFNLILIFD